jgi:hypothetical protein
LRGSTLAKALLAHSRSASTRMPKMISGIAISSAGSA